MALFETTFVYRVLSERSASNLGMDEVVQECDNGDMVGLLESTTERKLSRGEMAHQLGSFGSEPGFFSLDDVEEKEPDHRSGVGNWIFFGRIPEGENEMGIFNHMTLAAARDLFIAQLYVDAERGAKTSNKRHYGTEAYIDAITRFDGTAVNVTKMGGE